MRPDQMLTEDLSIEPDAHPGSGEDRELEAVAS
jgi:hypothetical protein